MVLRMVVDSISKDATLIINGTALINSQTQVGYYGNSQGGILGGAYLALSTQLTRGVLGTYIIFLHLQSQSLTFRFDYFDILLQYVFNKNKQRQNFSLL
jgi:cephalosporin-C deacetylase-like acetyl esterase